MAIRWLVVPAIGLLVGLAAQETLTFQNDKEKVSYAVGVNLAKQISGQSIDIDPAVLERGLRDGLNGKASLKDEEVRAIVARLQQETKTRLIAKRRELGEKYKKDGAAFLSDNKAKPGVVTLESGLQYKIVKEGHGQKPAPGDTVAVHYRGTLLDGTEFDSSFKRNQPGIFPLDRVIKGWSEALQLMPVGSEWQLFIPPSLAYGERGLGAQIGPNAALLFTVQLISIAGKAAAQTPVPDRGASAAAAVTADSPPAGTAAAGEAAASIGVTFKMDPRLTTGPYGATERWVSPPKYIRVGEGKTCSVEARAKGLDAGGKTVSISPTWTSADPDLVTVTPTQGSAVNMLVQGPGESSVRVTSRNISKVLTVKAAYRNEVLQVEITQK